MPPPVPTAPPPPAGDRRLAPIDPVAVSTIRRRLARAGEGGPSWLARSVAERMAERLSLIRHRPAVVLDASGPLASDPSLWRRVYPQAQVWRLELAEDRIAPSAPRRSGTRTAWQRLRDAVGTIAPGSQPHPGADGVKALGPNDPWPAGIELVWSNLALTAEPDPPASFARWQRELQPGGFTMFSTLGPDTLRELRDLLGPTATVPFTDMHDHGDMLVESGFADPVMDQERLRLTWSDPASLLADLRRIGGNAHPERFAGWRTPRWRDRWLAALAERRDPEGRIVLTIEVAYGHAFRVERPARGGNGLAETRISVDSLRQSARTFAPSPETPTSKPADLG